MDYLAFSFHKLLAPFGVGVLYAREPLLAQSLPFLYGGDMVAEGKVTPDRVEYGELPWKFAAGTPERAGGDRVRAGAAPTGRPGARRRLADGSRVVRRLVRADVVTAMNRVNSHVAGLTDRALARTDGIAGLRIYGPPAGVGPIAVAGLHRQGNRPPCAGTWPSTRRAWRPAPAATAPPSPTWDLGLAPGTCRLSFAAYTNEEDVDRAVDALATVVRRG